MSKEDFARRLAKLVLETAGHAPSDVALYRRCELRICEEYGGSRVYIRHPTSRRREQGIAERFALGKGVRAACAEMGISVRHGYRLARRPWKVRE